jgi:hypothetical protein
VTVTISNFRKNLLRFMDQALDGDAVEVKYKGQTIRLVREAKGSKLDKLTPARIFNPDFSADDHLRASRELFAAMQAEWEKDWSEL